MFFVKLIQVNFVGNWNRDRALSLPDREPSLRHWPRAQQTLAVTCPGQSRALVSSQVNVHTRAIFVRTIVPR